MKVLIVSNLYPPHHHGGYELRCAQVAEYLSHHGHTVRVVTSRYDMSGRTHGAVVKDEVVNGVPVSRFLRHHRLDPWQPGGRLYNLDVVRQQVADLTRFRHLLNEFNPDIVNWWNLEGLTKAMLRMPADSDIPSVHCIDDGWMIREFGSRGDVDFPLWAEFWRVQWGPRPLRPLVRVLLAPIERRLESQGIPTRLFGVPPSSACFISGYWRYLHDQAGLDVQSSDIIYGGVSPEAFLVRRSAESYAQGPLRLLYAGYMEPKRGLHSIIEAFGLLSAAERQRFHLTIVAGGPVVPDPYVAGIESRIADLGLQPYVTFLGRVAHQQMPAIYARHDVLVFASTRNEGMPMVMMEAMCAGLAVPNTGSGGAIELTERAEAPLFPKDHPFALSRLLLALEADRRKVAAIAARGQDTVLREFTLERMLARTADALVRRARRPAETAVPEPVAAV